MSVEVTESILKETDPEIWEAINSEEEREATTLELIASENVSIRGGAGSPGVCDDQQIRRRLPR